MAVSFQMMIETSLLQNFLNNEGDGNPQIMDSPSSQSEEEDVEGTSLNATALQGVP